MQVLRLAAVFLGLILVLAGGVQAGLITPAGITGSGTYYHDKNLIIDGSMPAEGSVWTGPQCVYWNGTAVSFTIDLGGLYRVQDILLQVDNNDHYQVQYSSNGTNWSTLFTINSSWGEIGWGMDTMSSEAGHPEYISGIDFPEVQARFLKIYATGGDNMYSVSELQAYGLVVPLPGAAWLLATGLAALGSIRRFKQKM